MPTTLVKAWICPICGYIHYGDRPPSECPVCGADGSLFEPYLEEPTPAQAPHQAAGPRHYLILGAGIAGISAAEAIRKADPDGGIQVVYSEPGLPYYRMNLTRYLAGEVSTSQLELHPQAWYHEHQIELCDNEEVTEIDLEGKSLLAGSKRFPYDTLILACGAHPFTPPIQGTSLRGVTTLRTRLDADQILTACKRRNLSGEAPRVVCIGGGILGLETAGALACRGAQVTVLENQNWLLPRQLNPAAARIFQEYLRDLGIEVFTQARIREIVGKGEEADRHVSGVTLESRSLPIPADLVIISAGVRPNLQLAQQAGLAVKNGVIVDEFMTTSHPDVFAAGDVAEYRGVLYGLWAPAQAQGAIAGASAAGQQAQFQEIPPAMTLKVLGINLFSIGAINDPTAQLVEKEIGRCYTGFLFKDGIMTAAILLGDASQAAKVKKAIEEHTDFTDLLAKDSRVEAINKALN